MNIHTFDAPGGPIRLVIFDCGEALIAVPGGEPIRYDDARLARADYRQLIEAAATFAHRDITMGTLGPGRAEVIADPIA